MKKKLVICGGGSSAHTLIPFLNESIFDVSIFTSKPEKWSNELELQYQDPDGNLIEKFIGKLHSASNKASELIPCADYIVLCMPVSKYRVALHNIAPYINKNKTVFVGAVYGQGGFNWMVDEIKKKQSLKNIVTFSFGLIPWICRIIEYGKVGVTYGCKAVNVAATFPKSYFNQVNDELLDNICYKWFKKGKVLQADNFLSFTLSVDNQIIHTSRCFGLYKCHGQTWKTLKDVPMFYKDYNDLSVNLLKGLDTDYSRIRERIKKLYSEKNFQYMLDYFALEKLSYQSDNNDIKESFVNSKTLAAIKTPVIQNQDGLWEVDINHRFFMDDIYYGNCIAKWIAEKMDIEVPTIIDILRWAQTIRGEYFIDDTGNIITNSSDICAKYKTGIPTVYGYTSIHDIVD